MSLKKYCPVLVFASLLVFLPAPAQTVPAPKAAAAPIQLDVVVTPKGGPPVASLQQQDFTLLDNKIPQPITAFRALGARQEPVEVVLVLDAVNTSYQSIAYERSEIEKFLHANGGHLAHPTTLMIFTDTGSQIQNDFSTDGNALSEDLDHYVVGLRTLRRSTGIYGADDRLKLSLDALHMLAAREALRPGRKLILWVSPGWPLLSGPGIQLDGKQERQIFSSVVDLSTLLRQARITLYSIDSYGVNEGIGRVFYYESFVKGVRKPSDTQIGDLGLQVLAAQSGGLVLNSSGVAGLLQQCVDDTEAYYELSFNPRLAEQPNEYHHLEIQLAKPGLAARTRQGYYAQP